VVEAAFGIILVLVISIYMLSTPTGSARWCDP